MKLDVLLSLSEDMFKRFIKNFMNRANQVLNYGYNRAVVIDKLDFYYKMYDNELWGAYETLLHIANNCEEIYFDYFIEKIDRLLNKYLLLLKKWYRKALNERSL